MTVHNVRKHAALALIVAALTIPLHVSASEPDELASQFQATAAEAAASFRKELKVNLAQSIRSSTQLHTILVVATLEDVDRRERHASLDQLSGAD